MCDVFLPFMRVNSTDEIYMNQHFHVQQFCPVSKNAIKLGKIVSSGFLSHGFIEAAGSVGSIGYMD